MRLHSILAGLGLTFWLIASAQATPINTIWVNNAINGAPIIQEYDLGTGALLDQFNGDGLNGRGIVQVGNTIYYTNSGGTVGDNNVYAYNYVTNTDLGVQFSVAGASRLSTMAYDGTNFWIGDYSGNNHAYLYSPTGTLLKTITLANCNGGCDGLEYGTGVSSINGGNPFQISNRDDGGSVGGGGNIYDVYDTNGNLLIDALLTGHDLSGNTGIAFDGSTFYVDNVYSGTISKFDTSGAYLEDLTLTGYTYFSGEDLSVNYSQVLPPTPAPEPGALSLFGAGLLALGLTRLRRMRV